MKLFAASILLLPAFIESFYLPGLAPKKFTEGQIVPIYSNTIQSAITDIPYDFYNEHFQWPKPAVIDKEPENLGSALLGDRLVKTRFEAKFLLNQTCLPLDPGNEVTLSKDNMDFIKGRIKEYYMYHWEIDDLPFMTSFKTVNNENKDMVGVLVGTARDEIHLNNYFKFKIEYSVENGENRIVGARVDAASRKLGKDADKCSGNIEPLVLGDDQVTFAYYYDIVFVENPDKKWLHRWDDYLNTSEPQIHWFNLINSIVIVLFLTTMVAMILLRSLHKDIARYNSLEADEDPQEDFGWKMVHGDVFRSPLRYSLLSVFIGTGAQLTLMGGVTLLFAALGFLSPSNRGSLVTALIVTYALTGGVAGYYSARFYKMFGGENWKSNVMQTAFVIPGAIFVAFLILNFIVWGSGSSAAVPFGTLMALICLWFLLSAPLCFVGAYLGFKAPCIEHPVRTNQIPRQIPEQPNYLKPIPSILMGGILPFGSIFIELFFIMNSIWSQQFYYVFGFLFFVGIVLVITCAEVTILLCYFHLCTENYHWWWRSFLTSGSSALYMFLYAILFHFQRQSPSVFVSNALYFGYSLIMAFIFFLVTGFLGFYGCFLFVRKIYGSIKVD